MTSVLVVILLASAAAFFGCFFLGLCRDGRHSNELSLVEVVRLSPRNNLAKEPTPHRRKSA